MVEQSGTRKGLPTDGGSIPTPSLHFRLVDLQEVSAFVKTNHYSGNHPLVDYCFGAYYDDALMGVCMFGHVGGNPDVACILKGHDNPLEYRELSRLVFYDDVPKNSESQFVSWCIRWLKNNTELLGLISFADPVQGHRGTIYQASNWVYTGLQRQDRDRMFVDGVEHHPKRLYNMYGTSSVPKLQAILKAKKKKLTFAEREPKHRYVYVLRPELRPLLKFEAKEYPKIVLDKQTEKRDTLSRRKP